MIHFTINFLAVIGAFSIGFYLLNGLKFIKSLFMPKKRTLAELLGEPEPSDEEKLRVDNYLKEVFEQQRKDKRVFSEKFPTNTLQIKGVKNQPPPPERPTADTGRLIERW